MEEHILYELIPRISKAYVCIDVEESYTNSSSKASKLSNLLQTRAQFHHYLLK